MAHAIPLTHHGFFLNGAFSYLHETLHEWRQRAAERAQLAQFDERDLHDIGLTIADQRTLLDKPLWRG